MSGISCIYKGNYNHIVKESRFHLNSWYLFLVVYKHRLLRLESCYHSRNIYHPSFIMICLAQLINILVFIDPWWWILLSMNLSICAHVQAHTTISWPSTHATKWICDDLPTSFVYGILISRSPFFNKLSLHIINSIIDKGWYIFILHLIPYL